jgi:predicted MFS family arabinose efflux permease
MTASNSMYTYLAVLLGGAARPVGLGLFIGAFGLGGLAGTWWGAIAADRSCSRPVVLLAATVLTAAFAVLPLVATTVAGALTVVAGSSATHLGFAAGALLGGLVVDAAGACSLWLLAVGCCGAGLMLHWVLTREARS